jgi:two-component system chemotaxis response regulator CheY
MRVLIAEDDYAGRLLLQRFLSKYGECDIAIDGLETLDSFLSALKDGKPYDLLCLDIMMPKLDGLKVVKAVRDIEKQKSVEESKRVRIIMTTALNDRKTVMESYSSGCEAFVWKPIDLDKFRDLLIKLGLIAD